jgi:LuxR family maltose regulon positive regulatory protein
LRIYRWPDAARKALQEEFRRREPRRALALHVRLANQYLREEDPRPALGHALLARDPELLVRIVERFWGQFIHDDQPALDAALAALPLELILNSPNATAARDVRMQTIGEVIDNAILALPDPLPSRPEQLTRLAHSGRAETALRTASSMMIAMRVRGLGERALDYADRADTISKVAAARQWTDIGPSMPTAQLQLGVTRLVFDRLLDAERDLRLAHHGSVDETRGYVRRDSAGKLALLHALRGDAAQAESWLHQHRHATATVGGLTPDIELSGLLAEALLSVERLDSARLARVLPRFELNGATERNWDPFVSYAHARQALVWGDRAGALRRLEDESQQSADATITPLLTALRVDLLLSLGHGNRARALLNRSRTHPALLPAAARLALLSGDTETALRLAGVRHRSHGPRARAELLLVCAIARFRQAERHIAGDLLTQAFRVTQESRALAPFVMVPRDELAAAAELAPEVKAALSSDPLREIDSPLPTSVALIELTDRERTVLDGIAGGRTLQEIAKDLFVSYNTVKTQVRSLYAKLGANSRTTALTKATEHDLLLDAPDSAMRTPAPLPKLAALTIP